MDKRDINELKKRLSKTDCTISMVTGCYVDANRNKLVHISETFLNLEDEEFYKYLDIARKVLSGTVGNNLLMLDFPEDEELPGGKQQFLMGLRASALENPELLDTFYDHIIDHYDYVGNYLILIFNDIYDVVTKTSDNLKVDESEEVYEYLLCAICPVNLSKPGLGYREDEHRIGARLRDWVVGMPDVGFVFPAFSERSADIHSLIYYVRDPKDSHPDFVEDALGCGSKRTAREQQDTFHGIVKAALGQGEEENEEILFHLQENLQEMALPEDGIPFEEAEPVILTDEAVDEVLKETGIQGEAAQKIRENVRKEFEQQPPQIIDLIDEKSLEKKAKEREENELRLQVMQLKQDLEVQTALAQESDLAKQEQIYDVILRVKSEKAPLIKSEMIDGQKFLIIPIEDDDAVNVNGVNTQV